MKEHTLDEDLYFEILGSERKRVVVLLVLIGCSAIGWTVVRFSGILTTLIIKDFPVLYLNWILGAGLLYELAFFAVLSIFIKKRRHLPEPGRYANAFVESLYPTSVLIIVSEHINPVVALNSPGVFLYFIFIILSIFRLKRSLGIFTGFICAAQFLALNIYYLPPVSTASSMLEQYLSARGPVAAKSLMLLTAGIVAGVVGQEIFGRVRGALAMVYDKNKIIGMFGQYVSPAVVDRLIHQQPGMESEVRHVCIMFLDIRGFTSFSENKQPQEIINFLNTFFGHLIEIINRNHGIINKFLGDGFMAVFGAPLSDGRDIHNAVSAAHEIIHKINHLNHTGGIPRTRIGIGLHSGPAVTGSVGSEERKEYTIIGDVVNLASRVEQLNKKYGSTLLVTETVFAALAGQKAKKLRAVQVRGRKKSVVIYKLI